MRWFQYGVFCPLFRLHGVRQPMNGLYGAQSSGADNEVWSFGEKAYEIIRGLLFLREKLKPYLRVLNQAAHEHGTPPMRPLVFDFPTDAPAANLADQFMLGPDLLVAPVAEQGARPAPVYLPAGVDLGGSLDGRGIPGRPDHPGRCASRAHPGLLAQGQPIRLPIFIKRKTNHVQFHPQT